MKYSEYKDEGKGSGFAKLEDGENRVRFVSDAEAFEGYDQQGNPKARFVAFVIDRKDGKVKPLTFGKSIMSQVARLAKSTEYGFDSLPPYDFIITKTGAGLATEYVVAASRKDTALTAEEEAQVAAQNDIGQIAAKLQEREEKNRPAQVINETSDSGIPVFEEKDMPF